MRDNDKENILADIDAKTGDNGGSTAPNVTSMTSRAYAQMKLDIISGRLAPGAKLKIETLRQDYNVGTSPIREALSLLTSDHFVERIDQRGFRVSNVSGDEFDELLRTRCWLEERALRESIARGSTAWEEKVVIANYRLSRIPRSQSDDHFVANEQWEIAHKDFHMAPRKRPRPNTRRHMADIGKAKARLFEAIMGKGDKIAGMAMGLVKAHFC